MLLGQGKGVNLLIRSEMELNCPICGEAVKYTLTRTRKGKPCVMLVCPRDPRHLRGFINHAPLLMQLLSGETGTPDDTSRG